MRIVFRTDASAVLGRGHVMRCLALADALAGMGHQCAFATAAASPAVAPPLAGSGHDMALLDPAAENDAAVLAERWPEGTDWLVVDHYGLDRVFESACRPWAKRILAIDDLANRPHDCDLLLDQTLGRDARDYAGLIPAGAETLVGPRYALIRPQFAACRAPALDRRGRPGEVRRLLVSMGGADPHGIIPRVLEAVVLAQAGVEIHVVTGSDTAAQDRLRRQTENFSVPVTVHGEVEDMAGLMSAADLAVGAGGGTSWERCCLGLPAILIIIADNQRTNARALEKAGAALNAGWHGDITAKALAKTLGRVLSDSDGLRAMSSAAAKVCDGRGAWRTILALLEPEAARDGRPVSLRAAGFDDSGIMLQWQRDERTRRHFHVPEPPSSGEHEDWLRRSLENPGRYLALVLHGGAPAGVLRLDRTADGRALKVSILVAPDSFRQGIGGAALRLGRKLFPGETYHAEVLPGNDASDALFRSTGYARREDGLFVSEPEHGSAP